MNTRVVALKELTIQEISKLPDHISETAAFEGADVTITTWHDIVAPGQHRVVVQALKRGLLVGRMYAAGFVIESAGIRELAAEELAPFT